MRPVATFILVASIAVLGGLYFLLRGTGGPAVAPEVQPRTYQLAITQTIPPEGLPVMEATQGDPVTVVITSERAGTLHLHGYEKLMELKPGSQETLEFVAARAGWFPIGLHDLAGNETTITAVQVDPR